MKQPTYSGAAVQFHFRVPSARLIILRGGTDGARESADERRRRGQKGEKNVTGKDNHVLSWKTKRKGQDRRLANVSSNRRKEGEEERQKIERKKWDEVGAARGETEVPVEGRNIMPAMLARHRDVLQPRRRTRARFIGWRTENLCGDSRWQVVLLARWKTEISL